MRKKILLLAAALLLLAVLFFPIPIGVCKDGGTRTYAALTYKIVKWKRLTGDDENIYQRTAVYWLPDNFKTLDELWEIESR